MAMTWEELAAVLERDVRTVQRWRKRIGAPQLPDVSAWRVWLAKTQPEEIVTNDAALPGECDYDDLVRTGKITYALAKIREQVIAEKVENEKKRVELAKIRGDLVTKADADKAMALVRDATVQRYERAVAAAIHGLPVELREAAQRAFEVALDSEA